MGFTFQPTGGSPQPGSSGDAPAAHAPSAKRQRTEQLPLSLPPAASDEGVETVENLKRKVRSLCLQNEPNESLLLLLLDDLARSASITKDKGCPLFDDLARQARNNQGRLVLASFVLNVLGEGVSDAISKALAKGLKDAKAKQVVNKGDDEEPKPRARKSPLEGLYPPPPPGFPGAQAETGMGIQFPGPQQPPQFSAYQAPPQPYGYGYQQYRPRGRGRGYGPRGPAGCFLCGSEQHWLSDCDKLKEMKQKL